MYQEKKYITSTLVIGSLSFLGLVLLFQKYTPLTLRHFVQTCQQLLGGFFTSQFHWIGLVTLVLLLIVSLICITKLLFSFIKTSQKLEKLLADKNVHYPHKLNKLLKKHQIAFDQIKTIDNSQHLALTIGFFNPSILLSTSLIKSMNSKQLEAVLLHEIYHLRRKHGFWLITMEIMATSLFFLPILKALFDKFKAVCELEADQFVIKKQGNSHALCLAIAKTIPNRTEHLYPSFTAHEARARINILLNLEHSSSSSMFRPLTATLFALSLGVALWVLPNQHHGVIMADESVCSENQCSITCDDHLNLSENKLAQHTPAFYSPAY